MCVDSSSAMLDLAEKLLKGEDKLSGRAFPKLKQLRKQRHTGKSVLFGSKGES